MMPTEDVTTANTGTYFESDVVTVAGGSVLFNVNTVSANNMDAIREWGR
jgi:2-keto-3-deoxy-6-phosphogluconate aldolase